ncbi:undecaprenyldiphospho-muramoylpentapeptide beta-N-acetylglucosaminyltransferase [Hydrogenovibrio sp. 3SP14C1]|uniref:undecaprenyldiphospho-muramoylpentapeptide beta-N-acetylglucosaminyltransferase n=1 Tax=Hydrogenovibrio sp. 3SP14C1 TaxID=3038774 RepID=UPI0024170777|nr:undecaprenyldiphospho-muramoylpentapeptide beta-N-acetylglucosaminyltransferase [Hydrogenovibrio sp. 3SP14C1]MDG4811805.1 undecaprenyldiphospho-muramoylpentapeptide beta-N-acetylglucosaminyltransferase [Hydrogenovibrio sp. 3SP14C1]
MKKILIMAGGTGGHVFPGLVLAEALADKQVKTVWLGTRNGMEKQWVDAANIPFYTISIKGLRGNGLLGWLKAPLNVFKAWRQARRIIRQEAPDLVLGMGGFVCGPGGLAALSLRKPLVLHEQNAIPGLTNKLLAPFAKKVICAFPQTKIKGKQVEVIGNPVRTGLESLPLVQAHSPRRLLVLGGSRGALALNEMVPKALALLSESQRPQVIHQTGQKTLDQAQSFYQAANVAAEVVPFIDDMVSAYQQADLVICRSGALTVSELMAAARPAILVPFPFAVDDHQTMNAQALVNLNGGEILQQADMTPELLAARIQFWMADGHCETASQSIKASAQQSAKEKIVDVLLNLSN